MTWIRVICTKTAHLSKNAVYFQGCGYPFIKYINKLSKKASTHPGFIKTDSYWKLGEPSTIVSTSVWMSKKNWQDWYLSEDRNQIKNDYKNNIKEEKIEFLVKRKKPNDIFLL